ncbi:MAG: glycosyltransferase family 39 protein [Candidatus Omnitrophica bacterium]|nr:glycosyltransferase family 39 protein [Candidatus Omnitrophota bacterium]
MKGKAIGLVFLGALAIRCIGIDFGLPHLFHQDEPIIVNHALAFASGNLNPHFFKIPPLLSYLLAGVYGILYLAAALIYRWSVQDFAILFFKDPTVFYLAGRLIFGALAGAASVIILYRLARKLWDEKTAVAAAFFMALAYMPVRDSHYLYADIPMILAMLVTFDLLAEYQKSGKVFYWNMAAVAAGIAVALKYIAAPVALPFLFFRKRLLSAAVLTGVTYATLNPFSFLDFPFFISEIRQQAVSESAMPFFHHLRYSLGGGVGWPLLAVGVAGLVTFWIKFPEKRWLTAFPFVYYVMIALFSQHYERYAMPIIPFLCLGAAWMVSRVRGPFWLAVVLAISLPSLVKDVQLSRLLPVSDTRVLVNEWIQKEVPAGASIVVDHPFFSPPLVQVPEEILKKSGKINAEDPHGQLKAKKIQWMLEAQKDKKTHRIFYLNAEGLEETPFLLWPPLIGADVNEFREKNVAYFVRYRYPGETEIFDRQLKPSMRLLKVFSPYKDSRKIMTEDRWAHVALPFDAGELFSRNRPGPYLELYAFDPA